MKRFFCLFVSLFMVSNAYSMSVTVKEVVDGDTFLATMSGKSVRISLINVDTPELQGQCAEEVELADKAKERLAELIPEGTQVEVKESIRDSHHERFKATVKLPDGRDIGEILLKEKVGRVYDYKAPNNWCK